MTVNATPRPTEIRLKKQDHLLEVDFDNGTSYQLPAEYLRVESPSAEVQGHGPGQKTLVAGRRHVAIMAVEPVGNYAVRLRLDALHDSGIYAWDTRYRMGQDQDELWQAYLTGLETQGLSRDP